MKFKIGERCRVMVHLFIGLALMGTLCIGPGFAKNSPGKKDDGSLITISSGSRPVLSYKYGKVPFKPYVRELFSPAGVNVLLDAPHDHLHHHALMYAVTVEGINFWEESQRPGRQQHRSFADAKSRQSTKGEIPGIREQLDWLAWTKSLKK